MTNVQLETGENGSINNKNYDLKERIFEYDIEVIDYLDKLPRSSVNKVIVGQCTRSVTSIGANYEEADGAHTKRDFCYKMEQIRKETKETRYWLKISHRKNPSILPTMCQKLQDESQELIRIFSSIINTTRDKE